MRLIVDNILVSDPVVPVRWCLTKTEVENARAFGDESKVVISIWYENDTEDRIILPATDVMTFLSFRRPGTHKVLATLAYVSESGQKALENKISHTTYNWNLMRNNAHNFFSIPGTVGISSATPVQVTVPNECFPKPVAEWVRKVSDMGFSYPSVDQCQLRRRMLGMPFKLVGLGIWAVITTIIRFVIAVLAWTSTAPRVDWSPIWHPWENDIADVTRCTSIDWWITSNWFFDDASFVRSKKRLLVHPHLYGIIFLAMSLIKIFKHIGYLKQIRYTLHAIFFLITHATFWGAISIAVAFGFVFFALSRWVFTEERERRRREVREEREREKFAERSKVLVCSMDLKADTSTIPLSQKSVRLLYKELKRKVCRPFAS